MAQFDKRVVLERQRQEPDENGNVDQGWHRVGSLWASVRETPGREAVAAGRVASSHTATVWLRTGRTSRSITGRDRIIFRGLIWDILNAHPGEGAGIIELLMETDGSAAT